MTEYPLLKILAFIALSFVPDGAEKATISGPNFSEITLAHSEAGWSEISSSDGASWETDELSISRAEVVTDLSSHVDGLTKHDWSNLSVLKLPGMTEVLKVSDGYWVYPNGIEYPKNKYIISYEEKNK